MLNDILKNLGLMIILAGVIVLSIVVFKNTQTNTSLGVSLLLIVVGLLTHIFVGRKVD